MFLAGRFYGALVVFLCDIAAVCCNDSHLSPTKSMGGISFGWLTMSLNRTSDERFLEGVSQCKKYCCTELTIVDLFNECSKRIKWNTLSSVRIRKQYGEREKAQKSNNLKQLSGTNPISCFMHVVGLVGSFFRNLPPGVLLIKSGYVAT